MPDRRFAPLSDRDLILCDFDGTVSVEDTGIAVMNALDLKEAWEIEHIWRRGEMGSMECLARQWGMVNLPPEELLALLDSFELRQDFAPFVSFVRSRGASLVIVSDGLDLYVDRMLARLGLVACGGEAVLQRPEDCVPRFANHAVATAEGVRIRFPHRTEVCARCGNCKLHHLFRLRPHFRRVIYIGDGHSDLCPSRYADLLFARGHLAQEAAREGSFFVPFETFTDILRALE